MPKNWKTYKLGEVSTLQRGFDLPNRKRVHGDYPVIAASGFSTWHNEYKVKGPGVTTGRSGTLGQVFYEENNFWPLNTSLWVKDFHGNDPKFIYYFLKTLNFQEYNTGTSVPTLNRNDVHNLDVQIPDLPEQKAIANILSAIDDKIENNLAINKTLEDMAMALYKHWFVDFGPFQDGEFIDSELGSIPKGWEVRLINDFTETTDFVANGSFKSLKKNVTTYDEKEYGLYIRLVDFNNGFKGNLKYVDKDSYDFLKKSKIYGKEVIISNVGANAGTVFRPPVWLNQPMTLGSNSIMILENSFNEILYQYFISSNGQNSLQNIMTGSAQPKFNKTDFRSLKIALPEKEIVKKINFQLESIQKGIINNMAQNQNLTKLRDTLLPKLISGEVRLKEFKDVIANAVKQSHET